jgi:aquaporin NIP
MVRAYLSETVGTFALVLCGTGAIVANEATGGAVTHVGVCITFAWIVSTMIFAFGDVSGAHFNPAVTVSFAFAKRFPWKKVAPYILFQCMGAIAASAFLHWIYPANQTLGASLPTVALSKAFALEAMLTFLLVLVILNVTTGSKEKGITAALAIGSMVGLEALFAGPLTGASMNPARSLAPALISGHIEAVWIYLTAPFLGALLAASFHPFLHTQDVHKN